MSRVQAANNEKTESIQRELRSFVEKFESVASVINNIDSSINQMLSADDGTKNTGKQSMETKV